jgi:hypothetical protein
MLHTAEIAGDSGSGKSITVWQLAHELHIRGWQVLRLDTVQKPTLIRTQGWQTVAVADDSQIFASDMVEQLHELANERLKLIFGTTDPSGEKHGAVRAAAKTAVEALASHCRKNRQTLLPIVRRFDSHIGDGFLDERIESRIDYAAKEQTPWQFIYVLRGGNRKVREMLDAARDFAQADLLLVLIAVRQLATSDAGTPIADLVTASAKIGRSEAWVRSGLGSLVRQRAILTSDVVRCLHLMSAGAIIEVSLGMRKGDEYAQIVTLVQDSLRHLSLPLRGHFLAPAPYSASTR